MKQSICLLFAVLFFVSSKAQTVIPFHLTEHNNIILKTLVNDKDSLNLMFQLAMEDASLSPERINKAGHILFDEHGVSYGNQLQIGNLIRENICFFDNEISGQKSDGKIGTGIFKNQIFKIDYDNNQFIVYDEIPDLKNYNAIPIVYKNEAIFIDIDNIINGKSYIHSFYLQSGYSGGLLYDNQFSDTVSLADELLVGFFTGDIKNQNYSLFGAGLLKRFNWIFDADRKTAYIQPSRFFEPEY